MCKLRLFFKPSIMNKQDKKKGMLDRRKFLIGVGASASLAGTGLLTACTKNPPQTTCTRSNKTKPLSPYLIERDTDDGGFSGGWLPHFSPSEELWVDTHVHLRGLTDSDSLKNLINKWFSILDAYRLGKVVCITDQENFFDLFDATAQEDPRFAWMYWPKIDAPSLSKVQEAISHGSCAIKLHNSPVISGKTPRDIYQSDEWQSIFAYAATNDVPLLWHAVSRVNASPYHGGHLHWLWKEGWENGVSFTNENLLEDMLTLLRRFPTLKIIGAHALYIGLDRLAELFGEYKNLYIDSSCSMMLRWADDFSEEVRSQLCEFIETWSERILFGSDASLFPGSIDEFAIQAFLGHPRFMLKLWLSDKALQDVAWRNAYKLHKLKPGLWIRRGNVRP